MFDPSSFADPTPVAHADASRDVLPRGVIKMPAKCERRPVIRFFTARKISAADIHRQMTEVYSTEAMRDSKVGK
ncbi:hypothetical protein TNCV_1492141 [Trichonephila clavipes]|nr:hypothetical protein TNCV_1492141 [Trichonephila clavipes]